MLAVGLRESLRFTPFADGYEEIDERCGSIRRVR
jgi:hypothetical protein